MTHPFRYGTQPFLPMAKPLCPNGWCRATMYLDKDGRWYCPRCPAKRVQPHKPRK